MKSNGEWGQFFPKDFSCFSYNESTSQQYYPKTKEQAISQGFKWMDEKKKNHKLQSYEIPDNIKDVDNIILQEVLVCTDCKKNYKIV